MITEDSQFPKIFLDGLGFFGAILYSLHSCQHLFVHISWPDRLLLKHPRYTQQNNWNCPNPALQLIILGLSFLYMPLHLPYQQGLPASVAAQVQVPATTVSWIGHQR